MTFGIFTSCYGYERWLPEWEASMAAAQLDEVVIVGDDAAKAAWGGLGKFVVDDQPFNQARAHNLAVENMTSEWVMHVGVDDLVFPTIATDLAEHFAEADVVACDVVSERDGKTVRTRRNRPTNEKILKPTTGEQPLDACAAFRRSFWAQTPYDESFARGGSDVALWIGFAHLGARFTHTGKPGVRYRLHDDSLWHSRPRDELAALRARLNDLRTPRKEIRLSTVIMAHPSRAAQVAELEQMLDRPVTVVWDERNDLWDTGRRALLAHPADATHHLVIQDDVLVCRDLLAGLEQGLAHVPDGALVSLYAGYPRPAQDPMRKLIARTKSNTAWLQLPRINWGPAVVVPVQHIDDIVAFGDRIDIRSYDQRIGRWCVARKVPAFHTWPCLVEHRDIPSLLGRRPGRHAYRFVGRDFSALGHNWAGAVLSTLDPPGVSWWRSTRPPSRIRRIPTGTQAFQRLAVSSLWERVMPARCESCGHRTYEPFKEVAG